MRPLRVTVPAPEGLGGELIGVPAGADLDLDLRLESVMEGVLVSGSASTTASRRDGSRSSRSPSMRLTSSSWSSLSA